MRRNLVHLAVLALLLPGAALALGLGEIRLRSALNAPLDAEIDLLGATPEELAGLQPRLASRVSTTRIPRALPHCVQRVTRDGS